MVNFMTWVVRKNHSRTKFYDIHIACGYNRKVNRFVSGLHVCLATKVLNILNNLVTRKFTLGLNYSIIFNERPIIYYSLTISLGRY